MANDPATLWYWGDWHGGTITFNRHLKGCYMDLLYAQFNNGHLSLEEVKIVLGSDFGSSWPTLQKKFKTDSGGLFFNERAELEKNKRMAFTESRKNNLKSHKKPHINNHKPPLMENKDRNEIENINEDWLRWGEKILKEEDQYWEQMKGRKISQTDLDNFLSVAIRNDWKMESQQAFRYTLKGFQPMKMNGQKIEQPKWRP